MREEIRQCAKISSISALYSFALSTKRKDDIVDESSHDLAIFSFTIIDYYN